MLEWPVLFFSPRYDMMQTEISTQLDKRWHRTQFSSSTARIEGRYSATSGKRQKRKQTRLRRPPCFLRISSAGQPHYALLCGILWRIWAEMATPLHGRCSTGIVKYHSLWRGTFSLLPKNSENIQTESCSFTRFLRITGEAAMSRWRIFSFVVAGNIRFGRPIIREYLQAGLRRDLPFIQP